MRETGCELLDDYLDGILTGAERVRFEQHTGSCWCCGQAVRLEHRLGSLARSAAESELVPATLATATRAAIERAHLRQRLAWGAGIAALLLVTVLQGCSTLGAKTPGDRVDPWEKWNRKVFAFNERLDEKVLEPLATGYSNVVPRPVRNGIDNLFGGVKSVMCIGATVPIECSSWPPQQPAAWPLIAASVLAAAGAHAAAGPGSAGAARAAAPA